ncbi:hypothetical protein B0H16DRAFT_1320161, partial [Mycena metata]
SNFYGSIYGDSTRQLYQLFGLISNLAVTPSDQEKPSYMYHSESSSWRLGGYENWIIERLIAAVIGRDATELTCWVKSPESYG